MRLRLTRRAISDLRAISTAIRLRNPSAATRVADDLQRAFDLLADHPQIGRRVVGGRRRFALGRFPYLIFYRFDAVTGTVDVLTIRHGARSPKDGRQD